MTADCLLVVVVVVVVVVDALDVRERRAHDPCRCRS